MNNRVERRSFYKKNKKDIGTLWKDFNSKFIKKQPVLNKSKPHKYE